MTSLRYGIIGSGMMGVEHIENLKYVDGAEVTAIADPNPGSRELAGAIAPRAMHYTNHRALIEDGACDAVIVASPNMTHIDVLRDLLATDLHVLVEKPLCTTVEHCYEVLDLAEGRDAITWVGLEYRYMPPIARLIEEVDAGAVGQVVVEQNAVGIEVLFQQCDGIRCGFGLPDLEGASDDLAEQALVDEPVVWVVVDDQDRGGGAHGWVGATRLRRVCPQFCQMPWGNRQHHFQVSLRQDRNVEPVRVNRLDRRRELFGVDRLLHEAVGAGCVA